ncbi:MAG: Uma2 family endonuclease [Saprospiraceae bacterium]|jgi:Uma2 family endonuclease|nr:Uma2 family endonuclease [Saprospiraceae bacterium]MBP6447540.1 Uma2 family endonuclease [Saprospiraceae bacterium]
METILKPFKRSSRVLSIEKYLDKESLSAEKHEYYNGKIKKMPGSSFNHNQITVQIASTILNELDSKQKPFRVLSSDQKVFIPKLNQVLYPDALVVYLKPEFWNGRKDILLNPILIVEVLSPTTEKYDRHDKFMSYKNIPTFMEYVMVRQDTKEVETWFREETHLWRETTFCDTGDVKLSSIGISISMDKVYRNIEF